MKGFRSFSSIGLLKRSRQLIQGLQTTYRSYFSFDQSIHHINNHQKTFSQQQLLSHVRNTGTKKRLDGQYFTKISTTMDNRLLKERSYRYIGFKELYNRYIGLGGQKSRESNQRGFKLAHVLTTFILASMCKRTAQVMCRNMTWKDYYEQAEEIRDEESVSDLMNIIEITPQESKYMLYFLSGEILMELENYEEALIKFDQSLRLKPNNGTAYVGKAICYAMLEMFSEAVECYNKAINLGEFSSTLYNNRGNALAHLGKLPEAVESFSRAIDLDKEDPVAYNNRANVLAEMGMTKQAIEDYDKALLLAPNSVVTLFNKGNILYRASEYRKAIECYDAALLIEPNNTSIIMNKGNSHFHLGELLEALACYDQTILIDPSNKSAIENRATVLVELERMKSQMSKNKK